jgi:Sulfotransferase family
MIASKNRQKAIPLLFIAGAPRSGSTLIERIIGSQDDLCPIGEAQFIWDRSFRDNQLCGCGSPFHECPFWTEVSQEAFGASPASFDSEVLLRQKAQVDKWHIPWLVLRHRPARYQASLETYADSLTRLYSAVLASSSCNVVIDSSKDHRHGQILSRIPGIELHVVHLLRDPRAVAYSWRRVRERPEIHWKKEDMPVDPIVTTAQRWILLNAQLDLLSRSASTYSRVRYEDFVADPGAELSRILAPFGGPSAATTAQLSDGSIMLEPTHTVSGNPMRFQHGNISIRPDVEWQRKMPAGDRRTVTALTLPLLSRYGYPVMGKL